MSVNYDEVYIAQDPAFDGQPGTFIQWKGTSVCMDIHCTCGAHSHLDEEFAYYFRCSNCGVVYALGQRVRMIRLTDAQVEAVGETTCIKTDPDWDKE